MRAIAYLLRKTVKNWVLDLKNKPQMLILIAFVVFMLLMSAAGGRQAMQPYQASSVSALFFAAALIFGGLTLYSGLSETRALFRMADVNLLFPAPLKPRHVILYGMLHNIGSLAFAMIFLVYQAGTLHFSLGMSGQAIVLGFVCLFFALVLCLTTSVCLMLFCSGRPGRLRAVRYALGGVLALLLIYVFFQARTMSGQSPTALFAAVCADPRLDLFPIIGWARGLFVALTLPDALRAAACGLPLLALLALEMAVVANTKSDYYEDVLDGASRRETVLQAKKDRRGGLRFAGARKEKNIRRFGIGAGSGASVFYHKRMLERTRGAFGFLGFSSVLVAGSAVFLALVLQAGFEAFLVTASMLCLIFRRVSSWETELEKTCLYLVPAPPERKLFFILLPEVPSFLIDGAITLAAGLFLFRVSLPAALTGAAAFISVCLLITGTSVVVRRIFGVDSKNSLVQLILVYLPMILLGIGLVPLAILQSVLLGGHGQPLLVYLGLTVWDVLVSALLLYLGRGLLGSAEKP